MAEPELETIFERDLKDGTTGVFAQGSDNQLYWRGERLATGFKLTPKQGRGAKVVLIAAALGGFLALLQIIDWFWELYWELYWEL